MKHTVNLETGTAEVVPLTQAEVDVQQAEWLAGAAQRAVMLRSAVKAEARRRILAVYPDWKQANMTARGVELVRIKAEGGTWTPSEQAEADALNAVWQWIKSVRAASDAIEADPAITGADQIASDPRWPAPSP